MGLDPADGKWFFAGAEIERFPSSVDVPKVAHGVYSAMDDWRLSDAGAFFRSGEMARGMAWVYVPASETGRFVGIRNQSGLHCRRVSPVSHPGGTRAVEWHRGTRFTH